MKTLGPCDIDLSWLNPTPHAIAVYASRPLSPVTPQHSLPSGRYSLLGPDLHRLDRARFAWRTYSITSWAAASSCCLIPIKIGNLFLSRDLEDQDACAIIPLIGGLHKRRRCRDRNAA